MTWHRVGDLIGKPTPIDRERPNQRGGATPTLVNAEGNFWYFDRIRFKCPECDRGWTGCSFTPQYDDDDDRARMCDPCSQLARALDMEKRVRAEPHYTNAAPVRETRDPLGGL